MRSSGGRWLKTFYTVVPPFTQAAETPVAPDGAALQRRSMRRPGTGGRNRVN
ncbi:hypothetical protein [Noviherbaspirillum saxi]|uniref:hypothetical protein n=1 Tax=Noviherbaspirillum saxi TaxID=2320863 RepID=UPI0013140CEF|nr:hypothetical protein [Noviherbaspirillum saxi]